MLRCLAAGTLLVWLFTVTLCAFHCSGLGQTHYKDKQAKQTCCSKKAKGSKEKSNPAGDGFCFMIKTSLSKGAGTNLFPIELEYADPFFAVFDLDSLRPTLLFNSIACQPLSREEIAPHEVYLSPGHIGLAPPSA